MGEDLLEQRGAAGDEGFAGGAAGVVEGGDGVFAERGGAPPGEQGGGRGARRGRGAQGDAECVELGVGQGAGGEQRGEDRAGGGGDAAGGVGGRAQRPRAWVGHARPRAR
ncbi:MAG: hypothetical protein ACT4RN_17585 [Pseudonocardia sp.]